MKFDNRPIGVFDSGIGGLTVLKHLVALMPHEQFIYLGDTARVPYGNKSAETVQLYSRQCASFLREHDVKLIVVACNTASALALDDLKQSQSIPVIGVIDPAARNAIASTRNGNIGVIGTRATITSGAYEQSIMQHAQATTPAIHSVACPLFVPLVEEGWLKTEATTLIAKQYLHSLIDANIDTLVLGCTHYPMLAPVLSEIVPHAQLIDCGQCAASEAQSLISPCAPSNHNGMIRVYVTDQTPAFSALAESFLGFPIGSPGRVVIDGPDERRGAS